MKIRVRFPIRLKILFGLLCVVTAAVSVIVFTMASLFHEDKKTYIYDLVSMTSLSTAEECRSLLLSYKERVVVYSRIMADRQLGSAKRAQLLQDLFGEFPELVGITQLRDGKETTGVFNVRALEQAGLTRQDFQRFRSEHPPDPARLEKGEVIVENTTLDPKLATLGLSFAVRDPQGKGSHVVSAIVRMDDLLRLAERSRVLEVFLATSDGTLLAHADPARVLSREKTEMAKEAARLGERGAGLTFEYDRAGTPVIGGLADVGFGGVIAGAGIPRSTAFLASRDLLSQLGNVALLLLAGAAVLGLLWAHGLTRPLERLSRATQEIAQGRFETSVAVSSRDEIGGLARAFNQMASGLKEREGALQAAHGQLIQSEKLAAFGQLGAGIAHEVKNPLAGILGCAQIALRKAEPGTVLHTNLQLIEKETKRSKAIIDNLLKFARQEKAHMEPIQVNPVVEDAVAIVSHQLEMNHVRLETDLAPGLPQVLGNANQLQQVLMNLMMNAQQAMEGAPGQVTLLTRSSGSGIEIEVRDTGPGIPREIIDKIFEPFFTTKPSGKGTGLGLSVSFGIIKDHGGEIAVESVPGRGTSFVISLPVRQGQPVPELAGVSVG